VHAWACEGAFDPANLVSNRFEVEWPPRSGKRQSFPEVDRAAWFDEATARAKIVDAQWPLVERALAWLRMRSA
jgi:predicted NUDIX family NTP pyrophosphohydrolase